MDDTNSFKMCMGNVKRSVFTCPYCGELLETSGIGAYKTRCTQCKRSLHMGLAIHIPDHTSKQPPPPVIFNQARDKVLYAGKWYKLVEDEE